MSRGGGGDGDRDGGLKCILLAISSSKTYNLESTRLPTHYLEIFFLCSADGRQIITSPNNLALPNDTRFVRS